MGISFFDAAADLVPLGFKVFPLIPGRKLPLIKGWQHAATDDIEVISAWAKEWPNANIGVATGIKSGIVVIDIDVKENKNGQATLDALAKQGKVLPPSPTLMTPSGGLHRLSEGYRRQALADLHELRDLMASMTDGRHNAPFTKACAIGKYVAHGFLTDAEIEGAFLDAAAANGALSKYSANDFRGQIARGLERARGDDLPPLHSKHRRPS